MLLKHMEVTECYKIGSLSPIGPKCLKHPKLDIFKKAFRI